MPHAAIAAEIDKALDVHGNLTTPVTLDDKLRVDDLTNRGNLVLIDCITVLVKGDAGLIQDLGGGSPPYSMNIGKRDYDMFVPGEINP